MTVKMSIGSPGRAAAWVNVPSAFGVFLPYLGTVVRNLPTCYETPGVKRAPTTGARRAPRLPGGVGAQEKGALECSSGTKVGLWRCFLIPRLIMGGNGAGWPSESKKT